MNEILRRARDDAYVMAMAMAYREGGVRCGLSLGQPMVGGLVFSGLAARVDVSTAVGGLVAWRRQFGSVCLAPYRPFMHYIVHVLPPNSQCANTLKHRYMMVFYLFYHSYFNINIF